MVQLKVGLVGAGVFGRYHAAKIDASTKAQFVGVYDPDEKRCCALASDYQVRAFACQQSLFANLDAVIVASPAVFHEPIVSEALSAGCHVMVEKPLALNGAGADRLVAKADAAAKILQVGHQERFVLEAMGLFDIPETPHSIETWRMSPPAVDNRAGDVSVVWDLMIHDLDMVARLLGEPAKVHATGKRLHTAHLDEASAVLHYGATRVTLSASRSASARDRRMHLDYPSGKVRIDFLERTIENTTPFPISSDVSDKVGDPLGLADEAFFLACLGERACAIPGREAALAVRLAEQADTAALRDLGIL